MSLVDEDDLVVLWSKLKLFQSKLLRKWVQGLGVEQRAAAFMKDASGAKNHSTSPPLEDKGEEDEDEEENGDEDADADEDEDEDSDEEDKEVHGGALGKQGAGDGKSDEDLSTYLSIYLCIYLYVLGPCRVRGACAGVCHLCVCVYYCMCLLIILHWF
jgi:hypothetical protein